MLSIPYLDIPPLRAISGTVRLPGSKSISNRALLLAGLSEGTTVLRDLLASDDTSVMLTALQTLGCVVQRHSDGSVSVTGLAGRLPVRQADLFLGNAGTAMRPLTAALAVLASLHGDPGTRFALSGVPRMHERPIGDLVDALRALGCDVRMTGRPGYPPLVIHHAPLRAQDGGARSLRVRGDVSSQFLTALLMALPLATEHEAVAIDVEGELISRPYVEITLSMLASFGVVAQRDGWSRFTIPMGSHYRSPGVVHVEGDASSASYFIAAGALAASPQAPLRIEGVGLDAIQGDIHFIEAARAMGAEVSGGANWLAVHRGAWPLRAIDIDANHIPDAAMTLAVMALFADGPSLLRNIASWRVKETDRLAAMATELRKLGAQVDEGADHLRITPPGTWHPARIDTYDDHRMAMCFSLAAFNPLITQQPVAVRIQDPRCVAKTFPDYFETLLACTQADPAQVPVITIDGPTASGKGTLASEVAARLGYHYLDSGAIYRATALLALQRGMALDDDVALGRLAAELPLTFAGQTVRLGGQDVTDALRQEGVGQAASILSALPSVRAGLLARQFAFRAPPGLVADGRDMGTVVFPDASLKVYLTASAAERAERRHKQLISKGFSANISSLFADLEVRDRQDQSRQASPLRPAQDAFLLDNSALSIEASVQQVLDWWQQRRVFEPSDQLG